MSGPSGSSSISVPSTAPGRIPGRKGVARPFAAASALSAMLLMSPS
jgi:hypothetical protein